MPFQQTPEKSISKLYFLPSKNKVRKLLHQTIFLVSLFSSKRLRLKSQAVALKKHVRRNKIRPVKISLTGQSPI
jgi:hypothetical protein